MHSPTARLLVEQAETEQEGLRFAAAQELATRALELGRESGDASTMGRSLAVLAVEHLRTGAENAAYAAACAACGLLKQAEDTASLLAAQNVRALLHWISGDESRAVSIFREALKCPDLPAARPNRCRVAMNLSEMLIWHREHADAIAISSRVLEEARAAGERGGHVLVVASCLAWAHVTYADSLTAAGHLTQAQAQLSCARRALPKLDPSGWRSFSRLEVSTLWLQIGVLSALGEFDRARSAAAAGFCLARRAPRALRYRADATATVAWVYRRSGDRQRAIRCEQRAMTLWTALGEHDQVLEVMARLTELHAEDADYGQALRLRKALEAGLAARQHQRDAMSRRLAVIERQVEAQLADARGEVVHAQQLSIIGRLIGQIHHALQAPIRRTQQLCVLALRAHEQAQGRPAPGLPALLSAISRSVDEAASLSRQLKIYAYRSSATTTTLSITAALHEVWATLAPHVGQRQRRLQVNGDTGLHVRADPQRLGVLLTLMMIELLKKQSPAQERALVTAVVEPAAATPGSVALVMDSQLSADVAHDEAAAMALIETLCRALAAEMGATLSCTHPRATLLRCILVMPDAEAAAR
jgi:tetratricopeptide (TPR) repeat protein